MSENLWNPWHGCHKISPGCLNCYVYRSDGRYGRDSSVVARTSDFALPLKKRRDGSYKLTADSGIVYTCFTSDFFVNDADQWREEAWNMMRVRQDLRFLFITKRIHRFYECIPQDWHDGYPNVAICCTTENQDRADYRLPLFLEAPIVHKQIVLEPLLEAVNITPYLSNEIRGVVVGGESGENARVCEYNWVLSLRDQCAEKGVPFHFKQTGANFRKDGRVYHIPRRLQHSQARKANINIPGTTLG